MRLEELILRIPGDELHVRFHEHLTVLSGIGALEREALADSLIDALAGTADDSVLRYIDCVGREVEIASTKGSARSSYTDDGASALPLIGTIATTHAELRSLLLLQAADLGLGPLDASPTDDAELTEARRTLEVLTAELRTALADRHHHDQYRAELEAVEQALRQAEDDTARREYAKALAELERVRAEAATLDGGDGGAEGDKHLIGSAPAARRLVEAWSAAADRVAELSTRLDPGERLDADATAALAPIPDAAPADLTMLVERHDQARAERDRLEAEVRGLAAANMPEPSQPAVVSLATAPQDALWPAADRLEKAEQALARHQLARGIAADGSRAEVVADRIEAVQREVEAAEGIMERRWTPTIAGASFVAVLSLLIATVSMALGAVLLVLATAGAVFGLGLPWRALGAAQARQRLALDGAGASTYLGFHLRRVDAATGEHTPEVLEAAAREQQQAAQAWCEVAAGVALSTALELQAEVTAFAEAIDSLGGARSEVEARHVELATRAEPALAAAREALCRAIEPYGVDPAMLDDDDPLLVGRRVGGKIALGHRARVQLELEDAEVDEQKHGARLDDLLVQLGFREGTLAARADSLEWTVELATGREADRARARSREAIEADLARLQELTGRLRRPEWASVQASDAAEDDVEALTRRREELQLAVDPTRLAVDLERLTDRQSAMERRVAALATQRGEKPQEATMSQIADVQHYLLSHLTRAAHVGPSDESVPVVLDEPFLRISAERRWELLDMLRRLGEKTQLVYLTDDPFVAAWARRRASAGLITLLEPLDA
jgi:hypothetical protein